MGDERGRELARRWYTEPDLLEEVLQAWRRGEWDATDDDLDDLARAWRSLCRGDPPLDLIRALPRWRNLTELLRDWYAGPLESYAKPAEEIDQWESVELDEPLPVAVREAYLIAGRVLFSHPEPQGIALAISHDGSGDYVRFSGIRREDLAIEDPPVYWYEDDEPHGPDLHASDYFWTEAYGALYNHRFPFSPDSRAGDGGLTEAAQQAIDALYPKLPLPAPPEMRYELRGDADTLLRWWDGGGFMVSCRNTSAWERFSQQVATWTRTWRPSTVLHLKDLTEPEDRAVVDRILQQLTTAERDYVLARLGWHSDHYGAPLSPEAAVELLETPLPEGCAPTQLDYQTAQRFMHPDAYRDVWPDFRPGERPLLLKLHGGYFEVSLT